MNKANPSLEELFKEYTVFRTENLQHMEIITPHPLDQENLLQAITKYIEEEKVKLLDEVLGGLDGLEVDRDATRKHIEAIAPNEGLDDVAIEHRLLDMETDADDRHDVLDDVRQSVESIKAKLRGGGDGV